MDVVTPAQVEAEIMRLSARCEKVTSEIAARSRAAAEADVAYKLGWAKQYLRAEGKTVSDREAEAILCLESEYRDRKIAEALLLSASEAGRNYRAQLDALRSINANVRSAAGL